MKSNTILREGYPNKYVCDLQITGSLNDYIKKIMAESMSLFKIDTRSNAIEVIVGDMGTIQRFDYTSISDRIHMASRIKKQRNSRCVRDVLV